MEINVVDAMMGEGKTSAAIDYMNNAPHDKHFLYITPYLPEVARIKAACAGFATPPDTMGSVLRGVKYLMEKGANIVSTHAMFKYFDDEAIDLAYNNNYTLIMDEAVEVVRPLEMSSYDRDTILEKYGHLDDKGILHWDATDYKGTLEGYKTMCGTESIGIINNTALWLFPIGSFRAFKEVWILTYFFQAQVAKYYFDMYGMEYQYKCVCQYAQDKYCFTDTKQSHNLSYLRDKIHICEDAALNDIGDMPTALSVSWYERNKSNALMRRLKNNITNFLRNVNHAKSKDIMWTCFKDYKDNLAGKGYTKSYVVFNMRARNDWKERTHLAYAVNRYFNPFVKNFFLQNGVEVREDIYALSEMAQWIWRSAIREKHDIWIYIPSNRMRGLLKDWLAEVSNL